MKELDQELWKYGIPAKTKHNEAAPAQHEIACIYRKVNITTDNNHLIMQLMQDIAKKHGLRCLLHEKPFKGVNGSGKHNNWSVVTDNNVNLFSLGLYYIIYNYIKRINTQKYNINTRKYQLI